MLHTIEWQQDEAALAKMASVHDGWPIDNGD